MFKRGIIHLNENDCPECQGKLLLISIERSFSFIDKDGLPIINDDIDEVVDFRLVCQECSEVYDVEKQGQYFKVKRELPIINIPSEQSFNPFSI